MNQLGASADPKGVATVASAWATTDLQAASDWALALPAGPMQNRAIATVVGVWAYNDPQGAENWLGQFPAGEARDRSIVAFLSRGASALSDAERSAEFEQWFDVIDDNWQRTRAAVGLFRTKWNIDPDAARTWLSSLPDIDPEMVRITLREYR